MEMNKGNHKYRNSHMKYVKNLFKDIKKGCGKLVAISNGGYYAGPDSPKFGFKVYFDKKEGAFNCQVYSQTNHDGFNGDLIREYTVKQEGENSLDSVITAILYNEYRIRSAMANK